MDSQPTSGRAAQKKAGAPSKATKKSIMDTAERLFGRHGFEGISLREIAAHAGQRNCNAVQYHFGDKQGLVTAILGERLATIDALRSAQLEELTANGGSPDIRQLLKLMWLPNMAITDADGYYQHCRFSLQYNLKPDIAPHPFYERRAKDMEPVLTEQGRRSALFQVGALLSTAAKLPTPLYNVRILALSHMFLSSVVEHDNRRALAGGAAEAKLDVEPLIDVAVGGMLAPH